MLQKENKYFLENAELFGMIPEEIDMSVMSIYLGDKDSKFDEDLDLGDLIGYAVTNLTLGTIIANPYSDQSFLRVVKVDDNQGRAIAELFHA